MIVPAAVVVDLDDTLYPQREYLEGAARATAARAGELDVPEGEFLAAFSALLSDGSDRGRTIDRALVRIGSAPTSELVAELREAFISHQPARLACYAGVVAALEGLRARAPLALLSDGDPRIQRAKLAALGLDDAFDLVVISDERFGRQHRKPDPVGLSYVADSFAFRPEMLVMIGDRVDKDVAVAQRVGATPIRVRTGEYAAVRTPEGVSESASFADAAQLLRWGP